MEKQKENQILTAFFLASLLLLTTLSFGIPSIQRSNLDDYPINSAAQDWQILWNMDVNTEPVSEIAIDSTGNITVVGETLNANRDQFIVQYDPAGNQLWNDTRDGGGWDTGEGLVINGTDIFVANEFDNQTSSRRECFLAKYDQAGNRLWNVSWFKSGATVYRLSTSSLAMDSSCNLYLTGEIFYTAAPYDFQYFILKLDSTGNEIWNLTFGEKSDTRKFSFALTIHGDGLYLVAQGYESAPPRSGLLVKFNASTGQQLWNDSWFQSTDLYPLDVTTDTTGYVYLTGYYGYEPNTVLFLRKYNLNGSLLWEKFYSKAQGRGIAVNGANIYVSGMLYGSSSTSSALLLKYNANGQLLELGTWDGPHSGSSNAETVAVDSAGNTYIAGFTKGVTYMDGFVVKNLDLAPPQTDDDGIPGFEMAWLSLVLVGIIIVSLHKTRKSNF